MDLDLARTILFWRSMCMFYSHKIVSEVYVVQEILDGLLN